MSITQLTDTQEAGRRLQVIAGLLEQLQPCVTSLIDYAVPLTARKDCPIEVTDIRKLRALNTAITELGGWANERSGELQKHEPDQRGELHAP